MLQKMKNLVFQEEGQALTEYGLIIGLIAVVCIVGVTLLGDQLEALFTKLTTALKGPSGVTE
ncbi:Flp family type IVb pilin [Bacillus sp. 7884-1]|jgi:pilus assembly protein Flp/PilA|uniref:Flp family type IVb pilin n=1 Tax=Bacillus sp. 7884-1 TaxID=2021693 RepID=UPI000BA5B740|nr:Flp family type IVb pilin [Bacillus sp. 7884-1]PAE44381.1 Flp family type IVb pilin [Bacillus sp. 7884-1]